ncbi:MAG: uncharacterized membrane protein YoaK (UPF0700 family) [Paraglaciecola sp.]
MLSRLPRWVEYGAFILAFVAGCVNAVGLLGFEHQSVSHLSGTATLLGSHLLDSSMASAGHLAGILLSFFIGAALSGFLVHGNTLKLGRHYDTALMVEAVFIFLAFYLLSKGSSYGQYSASAACGIQNALATAYSGAVVRTTHLTGIFTDVGIMFGSVLRGKSFDKRKAILFMLIISGFILGGTFGAYTFSLYKFKALLVPGCICVILAVIYRVHCKRYS